MDTFELTCQRYSRLMDIVIDRVSKGKHPHLGEDSEGIRAESWSSPSLDPFSLVKAMCTLVYDSLEKLHSKRKTLLTELSKRASSPFLDDIVSLMGQGGDTLPGRELFIEQLAEMHTGRKDHLWGRSKRFAPLSTHLLMELIIRYPHITDKLAEDSAYFPHRLFRRDQSLANTIKEDIAGMILGIFSPSLQEIVPKITDYIKRVGGNKTYLLGPYKSPYGFEWTENSSPEEIEAIYEPPDIKAEIISTSTECCQAITSTASRYRKNVRDLRDFSLGLSTYKRLKKVLTKHAINQMLHSFRGSGGKYVESTFIARYAGLTATIKEDKLHITTNFDGSTETLTTSSKDLPNSMDIPFCVYILNRWHQEAQRISPKPN